MTSIELVGNALCLDFVNTVNARPVAQRDWLGTADEARTWAAAVGYAVTGVIPDTELQAARWLREVVYRVFRPLAHDEPPPQAELDHLIDMYAGALGQAELQPGAQAFRLAWPHRDALDSLCAEVAASAVELLTHGPLQRIGECPTCGWLFLDTSKNGRRRWCSMATCGSRDKARRYYARHAG